MTTKTIMHCQWCIGGQLEQEVDGKRICRNCGRPHDEKGNLIQPRVATKKTTMIEVKYSGEAYGINHKS